MTDQAKGWREAYYSESGGPLLGVRLHVTMDRALTLGDQRVIRRAMGDLEKELHAETMRLDPSNAEWKRAWLAKAREMFAEAGLAPVYVREIDNEYCGPKCCPHRVWLLVTTRLGVIKIGWRKSVINIDWSQSDIRADGVALFASEDVTKDERTIHAYGYAKAAEYLARLAASAEAPAPSVEESLR
jgi:hypothetical protein